MSTWQVSDNHNDQLSCREGIVLSKDELAIYKMMRNFNREGGAACMATTWHVHTGIFTGGQERPAEEVPASRCCALLTQRVFPESGRRRSGRAP